MNNALAALPPVTPCPDWCAGGFHSWEPDGPEFTRYHHSANLASSGADYTLELFQCDHYSPGGLEQCAPCVILDGQALSEDKAARLVADIGALVGR